ncbi:MAG: amino acid racemase, partial [Lachnospiraceae bacterium]|nr:amino acid racemase [Lachnospiraceae bacterium]
MYKETIGLVGGFGAYATLDFFGRLLEYFPAEKESERPRIIMDNNFPMPSRVRAILYGEHYDRIVEEIAASIQYLMDGNADKIVLVCSTAHVFLPEVLEKIPDAKDKVVSLIQCVADTMKKENIKNVVIIGTEGTMDTGVYDRTLEEKAGIKVYKPEPEEYPEIRAFIESVKQKNMKDSI